MPDQKILQKDPREFRMKTVYIAMSADLVTPGHVQLIKEARKPGSWARWSSAC
jgi:hypothetical protein